ncbi:MAG: hypothetical protein RLZZ153_255 [Pseudomonadota bacterium]|jgi:hypothetical protein
MTLKDIAQVWIRSYAKGLRLRVKIELSGRKQHVTADAFQRCTVGLPGARIAIKVFMGQKLQAIDEDTGDSAIAQTGSSPNQR